MYTVYLLEQQIFIFCCLFNSASTGTLEFDFETDRYDIRIPSVVYETIKDPEITSYIPESVFSLRVRSQNITVFLKSFQSFVETKAFLCFCLLSTGILQYSLPEAPDAGYHSRPKGENSAHCQESGLHQKRPLQAQLPGILSSLVLLSCAFFSLFSDMSWV